MNVCYSQICVCKYCCTHIFAFDRNWVAVAVSGIGVNNFTGSLPGNVFFFNFK